MNLLKDLRDLFTPKRCLHCKTIISSNILYLCHNCFIKLEHTHFYDYSNNPLEKLFLGKVAITHACSLYFYSKNSPIQTLLKELKYKGNQGIGLSAAKTIIHELQYTHRFKNIDLVIPVPLHPKKEQQRGYNQIEFFGKTIANFLNIPFQKDAILKIKNTQSQTQQNKDDRFDSVENIFIVNTTTNLNHKNILIVDDVLTTGATLISCSKTIKEQFKCNISIITIACVV